MGEERRVSLQEIGRTVSRISSNDLPHIQARLNRIDIRLAELRVSVGWMSKLLIAAVVLAASVLIGVVIDAVV